MSESLGSELTLDDDFCSDIPEEDELDSSNSSGDFKHTFPSRPISELTENKINDIVPFKHTIPSRPISELTENNINDIVPCNAVNNLNNDNLQAKGVQRQRKNCVFLISPSKVRKKTPAQPKTSKWKEVDILHILNEHKLNNKAEHLVREYDDCSKALPGKNNEDLQNNDEQSTVDLTTKVQVSQNNEKLDLELLNTDFFLEEFDSKIKDLQKYLDDDDEIYDLQEKMDENSNLKVFSSTSGESNTNVEYKMIIAGNEFNNNSSNHSPPEILAAYREPDKTSEKAEVKKNSKYLTRKSNLESKNDRNKYPRMKGSESFDFHLSLSEIMISDSESTDRSTNRFMGLKRRSNHVSPRKPKNIVINYPSPHKHTSKVILNT